MNTRAHVPAAPRAVPRQAMAFVDDSRVRRVRRALVSPDAALALAETFSLLGDATRTRILHALSVDELCVSDLAGLLAISPSATSHQLRLLRDRRLVAVRREGKRTYYRLQDEHIRTLVDMGMSHAVEDGAARERRGDRIPPARRP
jgi:ArsR family transcriptional regulator, lead/cadmium/zinc/bismuth-responsive transcriptional repressor